MFLKCLGLIKNNHIVLVLTSMAYNFLHFSLITNILQGAKIRGSFLNRVDIKISGKNNQVMIGEKTMMNHCTIVVIGNNCKLTIAGGSTNINYCLIRLCGEGSEISIATKFTAHGGTIESCEGKKISIGEDCMFAGGVRISTTDHHSIIDVDKNIRINQAKDIQIGDHVWLGRNVTLHKGAVIGDDSIVGEGSIVNGVLDEQHAVYVGYPAKKVKSGTTWSRALE
ncbi:acyltransferase [Bacteroides finegoldii]